MDIVNLILTNLMHVTFPLVIYLLYVCYKKNYNKEENDLAIIVVIISILYIAFKFNKLIFDGVPFIIINIALIMAFYRKSNIGIILASVGCIIYYTMFYKGFLLAFILIYILYYLIYLKEKNLYKLNFIVIILHAFTIMILTFIKVKDNYFSYAYEIIFMSFIAFLVITLMIYISDTAKKVLQLFLIDKELTHEKQIQNSLFQITHEIKNPIAVCKGYLDMFDVNNKNHAKKYIPIIKDEISRTLYLLEDFLAMNKIKIHKDIVDINLLLEDVCKHFTPIFKENKIVFKNNLEEDEIYINGDYNRLVQVFLNLFKNSIEAVDKKGKIELLVTTNSKNVIIKITDNGCGISDEDMKHMKEAFYTTKVRGTGLGVSLSNEIILAHSGTLEYKSKEGEYTTVTVTIPLYEF